VSDAEGEGAAGWALCEQRLAGPCCEQWVAGLGLSQPVPGLLALGTGLTVYVLPPHQSSNGTSGQGDIARPRADLNSSGGPCLGMGTLLQQTRGLIHVDLRGILPVSRTLGAWMSHDADVAHSECAQHFPT
jgi:hypothetical protein